MIIFVQHDNSFLPALGHAEMTPAPTGFTLDIGGSHIGHLDVVQFFNGIANLNLLRRLVRFMTSTLKMLRADL